MSDNEQSPVAGFRNPNQPARRRGRFLVLVPFKDLELKADQGDPGHSLQLPDVVDGLEIEDIVAHVAASEIDAGFEYRVGIQSSLDGLKWSTSTNLLAFSGASQTNPSPECARLARRPGTGRRALPPSRKERPCPRTPEASRKEPGRRGPGSKPAWPVSCGPSGEVVSPWRACVPGSSGWRRGWRPRVTT
jgi:hypothetical protein